ncbi:putative ArsR-family transcriptional regulator [Nostocoides japonicum T1-X7]|uniref:Putative ArsR-family transcriptional regulator n=1 Tax=Nostocoides japonicum T1-X7 TaxID=1194083 RepID=A0A077M482_9MICO|nr:winged helix-turn-helix domain-containing protein [Tetrasphaera japonica]CCH79902.1 putative ArsR-family transcriptional regulator [Tetrasphaera japonica T1-X7]
MPDALDPGDRRAVRLDPTSLTVLAHPLRNRMLGRLRALGRATATDLARDLGTNTGATSYHLRRLAEVGLVEDTGEGAGKRRLWRPTSDEHPWTASDVAGDEDAETALNWLERDYVRHLSEKATRWLDVESGWPPAWRDALGARDDHVVATAEQVLAMQAEISAVVARYRRVGQGNPSARRVAIWTVGYPIDLDTPPRRTAP